MTKQEHGEGNYKATRDYNERTKDYVESADVEKDARKAKPRNEREARDMQQAEEQGKQHAKTQGHEQNLKPSKPGS
jgi:predicted ATP-dependent protease